MAEDPATDPKFERALIGVTVTHRRPEILLKTLSIIKAQSLRPDRMIVIDNEALDPELTHSSLRSAWPGVVYLPVERNLGPAGGISRGVEVALDLLGECDGLIALFDDDDPPWRTEAIEVLVDLFDEVKEADPAVGGVGLVGGQLRGRFPVRLRNLATQHELEGIVRLDWINGGYLPIYSRRVFDAGARFNEQLFFGYEELDFGLSVREFGFSLYSSGEVWRENYAGYEKPSLRSGRRPASERLNVSVLDAYKTRNLVWVMKNHGHRWAALYYGIRRLLSKVVVSDPKRSHRALRRTYLAVYAGWTGSGLGPSELNVDQTESKHRCVD